MSRPHEQHLDHVSRRGVQRGVRPGGVHRVRPRAGVDRLFARLGALRSGVPDALRGRGLPGARPRRRRRDRLVLGPHPGLGRATAAPMRRTLRVMGADLDLSVLDAITDAVESGAGLHEVVRAAARALDASLVLTDRGGGTVAVAVQSPADEAAVKSDGDGVEAYDLRVADEPVGTLRMRARSMPPGPALIRLVTTLIASEVERVRAPERAAQGAASAFVQRLFERDGGGREAVEAGAEQVGLSLEAGATVLVVRAHSLTPAGGDWRTRALEVAERGARAVVPATLAASAELTATSG